MRKKALGLMAAAIATFISLPGTALAHGDFEEAKPGPGDTLKSPPRRVTLTLSEAPVSDSVMKVRDACRRNVATETDVSGNELTAFVSNAEPGHWRVQYSVISSVDGHQTHGGFSFHVRGKKDCSAPESPGPDPGNGAAGPGTGGDDDDDGGLSSGIVLIGIGSLALIGLALIVRRLTA